MTPQIAKLAIRVLAIHALFACETLERYCDHDPRLYRSRRRFNALLRGVGVLATRHNLYNPLHGFTPFKTLGQ